MGSETKRYMHWLREFKATCRSLSGSPGDELDGYLNTGDFHGYYAEGFTPIEAAENELALGL